MHEIQLGALDLNLLVALDALFSEEEVGRAAQKIGVSASAMSHTLRRLRTFFDDPLLVKGKGKMQRTPKAEALAAPLHKALLELQRAISSDVEFDAASSSQQFNIATNDYGDLILLPPLLSIVTIEAAQIGLNAKSFDPRGPHLPLETGLIDLAIAHPLKQAAGIVQQTLFEDDFCCAVRRDHPSVGSRLDLDSYMALPHLRLAPRGEPSGPVDRALARLELERRVALGITNFSSAPMIVAESDLVLTAPRRCIEEWARLLPLDIYEPPFAVPPFSIAMIWHERFRHHPAHRWLREKVVQASG
ncbi:MAG: LysR family transcriptional regulator [Deltaproteobacteria bacterium]|nr:LysR family transcriptional regulator [Deltaproteobacteria bacterium]